MAIQLGAYGERERQGERDAVHVAATLVTCTHPVQPGAWLRFTDKSYTKVVEAAEGTFGQCVADPFLREPVPAWTPFWVLLRPEHAHNVTHHFDISEEPIESDEEELEEEDEDDSCRGCWD